MVKVAPNPDHHPNPAGGVLYLRAWTVGAQQTRRRHAAAARRPVGHGHARFSRPDEIFWQQLQR